MFFGLFVDDKVDYSWSMVKQGLQDSRRLTWLLPSLAICKGSKQPIPSLKTAHPDEGGMPMFFLK